MFVFPTTDLNTVHATSIHRTRSTVKSAVEVLVGIGRLMLLICCVSVALSLSGWAPICVYPVWPNMLSYTCPGDVMQSSLFRAQCKQTRILGRIPISSKSHWSHNEIKSHGTDACTTLALQTLHKQQCKHCSNTVQALCNCFANTAQTLYTPDPERKVSSI